MSGSHGLAFGHAAATATKKVKAFSAAVAQVGATPWEGFAASSLSDVANTWVIPVNKFSVVRPANTATSERHVGQNTVGVDIEVRTEGNLLLDSTQALHAVAALELVLSNLGRVNQVSGLAVAIAALVVEHFTGGVDHF